MPPATEGTAWLFLGRDKSRAQMAVAIKGKRLAQRVAVRMAGKDVFFRRSDNVVTQASAVGQCALDGWLLDRGLVERGGGRELVGSKSADLERLAAAPPGAAGVDVVTARRRHLECWALLAADASARRKKMGFLSSFVAAKDWVCIQQAHIHAADAELCLGQRSRRTGASGILQ